MWPWRKAAKVAGAAVSADVVEQLRNRIDTLESKLAIDRLAILNTIEKVTRQLQARVTRREERATPKKPRPPFMPSLTKGFVTRMRSDQLEDEETDDGVQPAEGGGVGS